MNPIAWLRRLAGGGDPSQKAALADRLRRELSGDEARLSKAAEALQEATAAEADADVALCGRELDGDPDALEAGRRRLAYAKKARQLAGYAFAVDRARLNITSGALHALERQLAESE